LDSFEVLRLFTAAVVLSLVGCTAAKSGVVLVQAEQAMLEAQAARAPKNAVYEYTLADAYRKKAREEWGNSSYGAAEELAAEALEMARVATDRAEFGIDEGALDVEEDE
jgi:hypothetical protein